MAAWFATTFTSEGNYGNVHNAVGDMIDFYNLQYYNSDTYLDCKVSYCIPLNTADMEDYGQ